MTADKPLEMSIS